MVHNVDCQMQQIDYFTAAGKTIIHSISIATSKLQLVWQMGSKFLIISTCLVFLGIFWKTTTRNEKKIYVEKREREMDGE